MEGTHDRRRFLGIAALTVAAAQLASRNDVDAQPGPGNSAAGASPAWGPLKDVDAGVLNVGYAEVGPSGGRAVILLHGWPYDIHSYVEVAPLLGTAGYRVIV